MARIAAQPKISDLIAAGEIAPVKPPTERPGLPAIPTQDPGHAIHFRGPLADGDWDRGDASRQWYGKNVPQSRISPPQPAQSASLNATIQSTAAPIIAAAIAAQPPSSGGGSGTVENIAYDGTEFAITNPSGPDVVISKNVEPPHTYFGEPGPGLTSLVGISPNNNGNTVVTNTTVSPVAAGWAFYMSVINSGSSVTPTGWTAVGTNGKVLSFTGIGTAVTATESPALGSTSNWVNSIILFSGAMPSFVQSATGSYGNPTSKQQTLAYGSGNTAGDTLIIRVRAAGVVGLPSPFGLGIVDSNLNSYSQITNQLIGADGSITNGGAVQQQIYIATNCNAGANTITLTVTGTFSGGAQIGLDIFEFGPLSSGPGLPIFKTIDASDIPPLPASIITNGHLALQVGGTGTSLSTTGGPSQFVTQPSIGAPLSLIQPDYSDLAGQSVATEYSANPLVGKGLPSIVFQNSQVLGGNVTINGGFLNAPTTGLYRVSATLVETVGSGGIDAIPECDFIYGDPTSLGGPITLILTPTTPATAIGTFTSQSVLVNMRSATPASFVTTGYTGTGTYHIVVMVEAI